MRKVVSKESSCRTYAAGSRRRWFSTCFVARRSAATDAQQDRRGVFMRSVASVLVVACCATTAAAQGSDSAPRATIEDIYVARSLRESRVMPTRYCAEERIGFGGTSFEDQYTFWSVETRPSDGLITKADQTAIGDVHACFTPTADPLILNFYGEGTLAGISFTAIGECSLAQADEPEPGITFASCSLDFRDLPEGYVGGHLTSSSILSRQPIGTVSDPPGYVQSSIATIRLWKRRSS